MRGSNEKEEEEGAKGKREYNGNFTEAEREKKNTKQETRRRR